MKQKLTRLFSLTIFLAGVAAFSFISQVDAAEGGSGDCWCPLGGPRVPCCQCGCWGA